MSKLLRSLLWTVLVIVACEKDTRPVDPSLLDALAWYTGTAGQVNAQRAKELLVEAAADGDPISRMWIARVYSRGRMNFQLDTAAARAVASDVIDQVQQLADSGVAEAVFLMGTAYAEGLGRPVDAALAAEWYRRAAEAGHVLAQHNLGNVYFSGTGVPQSDSLAVVWWTSAAEQGDAIPQLRLGTMFEEGRGVPRDAAEARRWYEASASRGNTEAQRRLTMLPTS